VPIALPLRRRRRARQRQRDDGHLLDALLRVVDVPVVACAADGTLTHASRAIRELIGPDWHPGTQPEAWIGALRPRTPSGLPLAREDLPPFRALDGEIVRDVDVLVSIQGRDVLLSTRASPVDDDSGRRRGALVLLEDVTEERRQEALRRGARGPRVDPA
jgi:PAS domain-containing protein